MKILVFRTVKTSSVSKPFGDARACIRGACATEGVVIVLFTRGAWCVNALCIVRNRSCNLTFGTSNTKGDCVYCAKISVEADASFSVTAWLSAAVAGNAQCPVRAWH